jgi:hypothetical protein
VVWSIMALAIIQKYIIKKLPLRKLFYDRTNLIMDNQVVAKRQHVVRYLGEFGRVQLS